MKKAVIYARYSCEKQTEISIEGQLEVCKKYAIEHDYYVVDIYIDRAVSGRTDQRDAFQKMLKDSALKSFEAVIVYKLDRFSRDKYESAIHRHTLRQNGVQLISAIENIPDTPEGIILESVLEGLNQYYSMELAQKVNRTFRIKRREGQFLGGRVTYGYRIENKRYIINEDEAAIIRDMFDMATKHCTLVEIRHKYPDFSSTRIHKILDNHKYVGALNHQGEVFENVIPSIVDEKTFALAQANLTQIPHNYHRYTDDYILSGKIYCGLCGKKMRGISGTSKGGEKYKYYGCKKPCELKQVSVESIETSIVDEIIDLLQSSTKQLAKSVVKILNAKLSDTDTTSLQKQKLSIERKINNIYEALENIGYDATLKLRLTQLQDQHDAVCAQMSRITNPTVTAAEIEKYLNQFIDGDYLDLHYKILKELVFKVVVFSDYFDVYFGTSNTPPQDYDCSHSDTNGSPKKRLSERIVFFTEILCPAQHGFAVRTPFSGLTRRSREFLTAPLLRRSAGLAYESPMGHQLISNRTLSFGWIFLYYICRILVQAMRFYRICLNSPSADAFRI